MKRRSLSNQRRKPRYRLNEAQQMNICWVNWVEPRDFEISPHVDLAWGFLFPIAAQNGEPARQIGTHQPYRSFDSAASSAGEQNNVT